MLRTLSCAHAAKGQAADPAIPAMKSRRRMVPQALDQSIAAQLNRQWNRAAAW